MNPVRKLLVVPIMSAAILLAFCLYAGPIARSIDYPTPYSDKAVEWHAAAMKSNDLEELRDHVDKLWNSLNDTGGVVNAAIRTIKSGLFLGIAVSFAVLAFCIAAFIKAKGKDRTMPSSKSSQGLDC